MTQDTKTASDAPTGFARIMPIFHWLPNYNKDWLKGDLIAGLSVWALMVPTSLGIRNDQRRARPVRALRGSGRTDRLCALHHVETGHAGPELVDRGGSRRRRPGRRLLRIGRSDSDGRVDRARRRRSYSSSCTC